MARTLAIDLARLMMGLVRATPRGIDRVEFGLARALLAAWPGDAVGIVPSPWGVRLADRAWVERFLALMERLWREAGDPQAATRADAVFAWLQDDASVPGDLRSAAPAASSRVASGIRRLIAETGISWGASPARTLPVNSLYLNVGQSMLAVTPYLNWIYKRPDIGVAIMLHDAIPLEHPDFVPPMDVRHFHRIVANTARFANGLIVSTEAAGRAVRAQLALKGRNDIPGITLPLPIADAFAAEATENAALARPYFICCGAIEPRKNHTLLIDVWRKLAAKRGAVAPKLVIVGSRHRPGKEFVAALNDTALRAHICEVGGLPTPALVRLLRGARASLMPSFAEGFGLPIVEALATGTPVIASDIGAHREAGGDATVYLDPHDEAGWLTAIEKLADAPSAATHHVPATVPWRWPDYAGCLIPFLQTV